MKGIELPINALIIIVVAVIVLLGLTATYFTGFSPFSSTVSIEGAKNEACACLIRSGCRSEARWCNGGSFDADRDGKIDIGANWNWAVAAESQCWDGAAAATEQDNLASLCLCWYGRGSEVECRKLCGCP